MAFHWRVFSDGYILSSCEIMEYRASVKVVFPDFWRLGGVI